MATVAMVLFVAAVIALIVFMSFPELLLDLLNKFLRWRRQKLHSALCGQTGTATSDFTHTLAGTIASGQVQVAGTIWNAKCRYAIVGGIAVGDPVEVESVEGETIWVKKSEKAAK